MSMEGRVALVTGAGSGLGEASLGAWRRPVKVGLLGRTRDSWSRSRRQIEQAGGTALA